MVSYNFLRLFGLKRSKLEQNMKQAELNFINFCDHYDPYTIHRFPQWQGMFYSEGLDCFVISLKPGCEF